MNFTVSAGELLMALKFCRRTAARAMRDILPTNGFLLIAGVDSLTVIATDMETELTATIAVEVGGMGSAVLPAKLADICAALPADAAVFVVFDKDIAIVKSGRSCFKLNTFAATDFPRSEPGKSVVEVTADVAALRGAMAAVSHAMADKDVRYYLNGTCFEVAEGVMKLAATNGHRLAVSTIACVGVDRRVIVPHKACALLLSALDSLDVGEGRSIALCFDERAISCESDGWSLHAKLVDGKFPQVDRVLPVVQDAITLDRLAVLSALKRVCAFGNDNAVRVSITETHATIDVEKNEGSATEALEGGGRPITIGLHVGYFVEAVQAVSGDQVTIGYSDENKGVLITGSERGAQCVIMPARL